MSSRFSLSNCCALYTLVSKVATCIRNAGNCSIIPPVSLKKSFNILASIDPEASKNTAISIIGSSFIPGITASMCQPLRLERIHVKSDLIVLSNCIRNNSRQFILGAVISWIRRLTPAGKLPAPSLAAAAANTASLISSRMASFSVCDSLGRPLPSPPSLSPSIPSPSMCSSKSLSIKSLILIFSAFSYKIS